MKGKNTVKVCPENGNGISESGYSKFLKKVNTVKEEAVSQNQQQLAGMALAFLRGDMPDASEEVKKMAKMGEKELRKFAKTKHEGLPEKVKEEAECNSDDSKEEEDPRSMKTKINLVKNKLRAMGLKMSYEPEGDQISEGDVPPEYKNDRLGWYAKLSQMRSDALNTPAAKKAWEKSPSNPANKTPGV